MLTYYYYVHHPMIYLHFHAQLAQGVRTVKLGCVKSCLNPALWYDSHYFCFS